MKFKVVIGTFWLGKDRYVRGDIIDIDPSEAVKHGTRLEPYIDQVIEPVVVEEKPKRKRRTKAEMEAARNESR